MRRTFLATTIVLMCATISVAATSVVDENFDSYTGGTLAANQAAFEAVWRPEDGPGNPNGLDPAHVAVLAPNPDLSVLGGETIDTPYENPTGLQGVGAIGRKSAFVNEWDDGINTLSVMPSSTESVRYGGDIFNSGVASSVFNWRQSIGLRNDNIDRSTDFGNQFGLNLLEIGFYNADSCDITDAGCVAPGTGTQVDTDPWFIPSTQFGYRITLFDNTTLGDFTENGVLVGAALQQPNYQYFQFNPDLDLAANGGNEDGVVDLEDIGEGWHSFAVTITETDVTFEVDLFRNGVDEITGAAGPDATATIQLSMNGDPLNPGQDAPFTSLRIGGQSGITGNENVVFDNVFLSMVDVGGGGGVAGDFNNNGVVDAADYTTWLDNLGSSFDLNGNGDEAGGSAGVVDQADYALWKSSFGNSVGVATGGAVPEPCSLLLLTIALLGITGVARSRG